MHHCPTYFQKLILLGGGSLTLGIIYGKAVNITNDSRCLKTMLIFDEEDGRISHIRYFRSRPSVGSIFILTDFF